MSNVPCRMSYVLVKPPNDQITYSLNDLASHLGNWSFDKHI